MVRAWSRVAEGTKTKTLRHTVCTRVRPTSRTSKSALEGISRVTRKISAEVKELLHQFQKSVNSVSNHGEIRQWADERAKHSGSLDVHGALHRASTTQNKTLQGGIPLVHQGHPRKAGRLRCCHKIQPLIARTLNIIRDNAAFAVDFATFIEGSFKPLKAAWMSMRFQEHSQKLYAVSWR